MEKVLNVLNMKLTEKQEKELKSLIGRFKLIDITDIDKDFNIDLNSIMGDQANMYNIGERIAKIMFQYKYVIISIDLIPIAWLIASCFTKELEDHTISPYLLFPHMEDIRVKETLPDGTIIEKISKVHKKWILL